MIIDFHTHVYPDKIAARTVEALCNVPGVEAKSDGTLKGLLSAMETAQIDRSIILPVSTRAGQFDSITRFAKEINETYSNLTSFGGIHPDDTDIEEKLRYLKDNGFKGIKIHPDYTETFIDDKRYIRIIAECKRLGLIVVTHAGKDPAYDEVHCPPKKGREMLEKVDSLVGGDKPFFVFAHLGGAGMLDDIEKYLVGQNCYLDISCAFKGIGSFGIADDEQLVRIIHNHGADKFLFATDSPWNDQREYIEKLKSLRGLTDSEKDMIFGANAERLLNTF